MAKITSYLRLLYIITSKNEDIKVKTNIILIAGMAKCGKDFTAKIIKEKLEDKGKRVMILHFADDLKALATRLYEWDGKKDEHGRTLLQWLGTDVIRARCPDYWVESVARLVRVLAPDYDYFIIPDWRFINEDTYWNRNEFNVMTIKVIRDDYTNDLTEDQKNHASEHNLDDYKFDHILHVPNGKDLVREIVGKFTNKYL